MSEIVDEQRESFAFDSFSSKNISDCEMMRKRWRVGVEQTAVSDVGFFSPPTEKTSESDGRGGVKLEI